MAQLKAIVDKLLTNVSQAYVPSGYISEALFPKIMVQQDSGLLGKYGNQHLRIEKSIMGGRGKARRVEAIVRSSQSYKIEHHGLEGVVTREDYRNVEAPFDAERDETMGLTSMIWLEKEKLLADVLSDTAVVTQNVTLTLEADQFHKYGSSDPIGKFLTARNTIRSNCGEAPDTAWMDWNVAQTLAYHPGILDALGYTQARAGQLNEAELAKAMGVKRLLIGMPSFNSAKEGQADSLGPVWGKHIWFAKLPETAMPYQKSFGYYLVPGDIGPRRVYKYSIDNPPEANGIIVQDSYQHLISDVKAGYLIKNAIA